MSRGAATLQAGPVELPDGPPPRREVVSTAAGVVALYSAGVYKGEAVQKGLDYLMRNCRPGNMAQHPFRHDFRDIQLHYYYGHYYAAQAMWIRGGDDWLQWYPAIRDELVQKRSAQGCWTDSIGNEYATSMALIILQMPNNYLPILQR